MFTSTFCDELSTSLYCSLFYMQFTRLKRRMERCSKVLLEDIQTQYKWWPTVELASRFILIISITLTPDYQVNTHWFDLECDYNYCPADYARDIPCMYII